jgi:thioredoxin-related protein
MFVRHLAEFKRFLAATLIAFAVMTAPDGTLNAARSNATEPPPTNVYELVVAEVEGCTYCDVFRRDVLPAYMASPRSKELPIRFLDLNAPEAAHLVLQDGPLTVVPTLLLVKANREVSRVPGYMGPDNFFRSVQWMMNAAP